MNVYLKHHYFDFQFNLNHRTSLQYTMFNISKYRNTTFFISWLFCNYNRVFLSSIVLRDIIIKRLKKKSTILIIVYGFFDETSCLIYEYYVRLSDPPLLPIGHPVQDFTDSPLSRSLCTWLVQCNVVRGLVDKVSCDQAVRRSIVCPACSGQRLETLTTDIEKWVERVAWCSLPSRCGPGRGSSRHAPGGSNRKLKLLREPFSFRRSTVGSWIVYNLCLTGGVNMANNVTTLNVFHQIVLH